MREIEFRAWDFNRYHYDGFMVNSSGAVYVLTQGFGLEVVVKDWILEQYTGKKDKNGKKIYEGDIIDPKQNYVIEFNKDSVPFPVMPVEYHYGKFILVDKINQQTWPLNEFRDSKVVIGNIHEQPEGQNVKESKVNPLFEDILKPYRGR